MGIPKQRNPEKQRNPVKIEISVQRTVDLEVFPAFLTAFGLFLVKNTQK